MAREATRDDDEKRLTMLAMRDEGRNSHEVAAAIGMTAPGVRATFARMDRDFAASERAA